MARAPPKNLLALYPVRRSSWTDRDGDLVDILVPRFRSCLGRRLAQWLGRSEEVRVRLDAFGSAVWRRSTGRRTVEELGFTLRREFGDAVEPLYPRLGEFLRTLVRMGLLELCDRPGRSSGPKARTQPQSPDQ